MDGFDRLSPEDQAHLKLVMARSIEADRRLLVRIESDGLSKPGSLRNYVREAWKVPFPSRPMGWNWHIDYLSEYLEAWYRRDIKRLLINIPPRFMKSLFCGVFFPTWVWTHDPESPEWRPLVDRGLIVGPQHQFLTLSHSDRLSIRDALKSRRLIQSKWYQDRWGHRFKLSSDQSEKRRYENDRSGHRIAQGMTGGVTGEGGDSLIMDDPHDAEKAQSELERENTLDSYDGKISTRMNDPETGGELLIMQRLHSLDLSGHWLDQGGVEHLCLPMEYEPRRYVSSIGLDDPRTEPGELLWPGRFSGDAVERIGNKLGPYGKSGQFQQRPSPTEGGILKKTWWRRWPEGRPLPEIEFVLQSWDPAQSKTSLGDAERFNPRRSRSARTTWGVFTVPAGMDGAGRKGVLLMERYAEFVDYPDMRKEAKRAYREWSPNHVIIENKASGPALITDLRMANIPVMPYNPDVDKIARAYTCQSILSSGQVWYVDRRWAEEVIDECGQFPTGTYDDLVDTCTQAWLFIRNMWRVRHPDDEDEDDDDDDGRAAARAPLYG